MISSQEPYEENGRWHFSNGESVPVVRGGSDTWVPSELSGLGEGSVTDTVVEDALSDFAQGILNQIPEEDREVVGRHIKTWDGGVTKKFQELHEQYKPYKDFGPLEEVQQYVLWGNMLNDDPVTFIQKVQEAMKAAGIPMGAEPTFEPTTNLPEYEGVPEAFIQRHTKLENDFNELKSMITQQNEERSLKEAASQFDNLMKTMHTEHGEFDEDWMLVQMQKGINPDDAIKKWKKDIVEKFSSPRKSAPNLVSGSGGVPSSQVDISKMTQEQKKAYVVAKLQATIDENRA